MGAIPDVAEFKRLWKNSARLLLQNDMFYEGELKNPEGLFNAGVELGELARKTGMLQCSEYPSSLDEALEILKKSTPRSLVNYVNRLMEKRKDMTDKMYDEIISKLGEI